MKNHDLPLIQDWTRKEYLPDSPVEVEHIRSLTNDVYLIKTPENKFVLKVYGVGWRNKSAIAWEVDLLDHLARKGVKLAKALPGVDGEAVRTIILNDESRYAVLFEYADGHKPQEPFTDELYEAEGRAVATMHAAGDDFTSSHERPDLDFAYLIDQPIADVLEIVDEKDANFLVSFGDYLKTHISRAAEMGLDWGPVHGDMTLDNLHELDDGSIEFYDFDSGGMGWRASDIQGWATAEENNAKWQAFLKGYQEVRDLGGNDINAAPYIWAAWEVWSLSSDFTKRIAKQGDAAVTEYLNDQISRLRQHEQRLKEWEARQS